MDINTLMDLDKLDGRNRPTLRSASDTSHPQSRPDSSRVALGRPSDWIPAPDVEDLGDAWTPPSQTLSGPWPDNDPDAPGPSDLQRFHSHLFAGLGPGLDPPDQPPATATPNARGYTFDPSPSALSGSESFTAARAREEDQWQMYLTASLSNPLALEFDEGQNQGGLGYLNPPERFDTPTAPPERVSSQTVHPRMLHPTLVEQGTYEALHGFPSTPPASSSPIAGQLMYPEPRMDTPGGSPSSSLIHPNKMYPPLMSPTNPRFDFGSAPFSSLEPPIPPLTHSPTASSSHGHSPVPDNSVHPALLASRRRNRKGLVGWSDALHLPVQRTSSPASHRKRPRAHSAGSSDMLIPPSSLSPISSSADSGMSSGHSELQARSIGSFRSTSFLARRTRGPLNLPEDDSEDAGGDSDEYSPSRSTSAEPHSFSSPQMGMNPATDTPPARKKVKRGKGKAKGSAALALAVVTQMGTSSQSRGASLEFDPSTVDLETHPGIRKRKNNPIPLPVPVPNLNKKSRGRKVPYVANVSNLPQPTAEGRGEDGEEETPKVSRRGRKAQSSGSPSTQGDGERSYVCVVAGCGKCFVRGEHLKRHVRSIHTHDKPHPCPFEGCDKSFSRRDNLGQHVRIHLQHS